MPRRRQAEMESTRSASGTPTDSSLSSGESLPAPTTLLTHVLDSRLRRTTSRSSRASGSNSTSNRASRNSSQARLPEAVDTPQPEPEDAQPGPSNLNGDVLHRTTRSPPGRQRRRAYSIRDEMDDQPSTSSPSTTSEGFVPPETPPNRPPPNRKKRTAPPKRAKRRRKLNNSQALDVGTESEAGPSTLPSMTSTQITSSEPDVEIIPLPGETTAVTNGVCKLELSPPPKPATSTPTVTTSSELLAEYTCPICFSTPTNATMTPCGHICCGECLFTAVRSTLQRAPVPVREPVVATCPVCRVPIKGWDGRGGGVIGLKPRSIISL